jgi:hypothetical protein
MSVFRGPIFGALLNIKSMSVLLCLRQRRKGALWPRWQMLPLLLGLSADLKTFTITLHFAGHEKPDAMVYQRQFFPPINVGKVRTKKNIGFSFPTYVRAVSLTRGCNQRPAQISATLSALRGPPLALQPQCFCPLLTCRRLNGQSKGPARTTRIVPLQSRTGYLRGFASSAVSA